MNGKQLAILVVFIGAAALLLNQNKQNKASEFESWKQKHGISFATEIENQYREKVFLVNLREVQEHNSKNGKSYTKALNHFSAMTNEEWAQIYLTLQVDEDASKLTSVDTARLGDIDWESAGAVTHVKDQGACGSCWAFSAVGGLEGLSKLADDDLKRFSEQQLLDCAYLTWGNLGCNGGQMFNALAYVRDNGILEEDKYTSYSAKRETCKNKTGPFRIKSHTKLDNCNDLANALSGRPVSVAVDATNWSKYGSGVFDDCQTQLNHGVLLTGSTDDYWMIKNSWGNKWGLSGYIKLARGNTCGVCNSACYPNA